MEIVRYTSAHREAIGRLNEKLARAGSEWRFPARERPRDADELPVYEESFVAVDGDEVCGGYILKHQQFFLDGTPFDVGSLQLPLSLGQIDSEYAHVSVALLFDAIRRSPCLYSLGLGSEDTQFARLLTAARWQHVTVPFYFSVKSGNAFARNIRLPAGQARIEKALRAIGHLRLAGVALRLRAALRASSARTSTLARSVRIRELPDFANFADDLFTTNVDSYVLVADRRATALDEIYPPSEPRYIRLAVESNGTALGWALALDTAMSDDKYFGNMRVGSIADCFSAPDDAGTVVAAADDFLTRRGVDIVVSNQLHARWRQALEDARFERGPSNFFFYFSEELGERLKPLAEWEQKTHLNRGDGEGPAHL